MVVVVVVGELTWFCFDLREKFRGGERQRVRLQIYIPPWEDENADHADIRIISTRPPHNYLQMIF
jgi:hypothetical protein